MRILAADYILPISSAPISKGAVVIDDSVITAVGERRDVAARYPDVKPIDLGNAAILPGFINCHSHLEVTALRGALDDVEHDFHSWLLKLNGLRAGLSDEEIRQFAILGAREAASSGVTCLGDIGRFGEVGLEAIKETGLRGVVFQETEFSPDDRTADDDFLKLTEKFERLHAASTDLVRVGLSPHSPYTVSSRLFELIAEYAIINRLQISIHAAESSPEIELLTRGTGFFTGVYEKFDVEWHSPHCSPIEYLERLGVLSAQPLLAHCVKVSATDLSRIKANGAKIAHCPKSNAKFGHGYAPFERFLDEGIAVGLGSDSVASNNVCDLLEEARFASLAARNREGSERFIEGKEVLEAATLGGAKALGIESITGSLEPGKQADLTVVSLDNLAQQPIGDIHAALTFSSNARDIILTMVAGREVFKAS